MSNIIYDNPDTYLICPVCNVKYEMITTQHIKKHGFENAQKFKEIFKLDFLKSKNIRDKQSSFMSENNNSKNGRTQETKDKISKNRAGKGIGVAGKYKRTAKIRQQISKKVAKLHMDGAYRQNKNGQKGYHFSTKMNKSFYYASSWERRIMECFDKSPKITAYYYEPVEIPYYFCGSEHVFIPDFKVVYDNHIESIWEVKRKDFIDHDFKTKEKISALKEYCFQNNLNMFIITLKDIEKFEKFLKSCSEEELNDYDKYVKKAINE